MQPKIHWLPEINWNVKFFGGHFQKVEFGWNAPKEAHIGFEINLVLEGMQETVMEKSRYMLHAGDILLIPPGFRHINRCVDPNGMRYFCAHFNVDDPDFGQRMIKHGRVLFMANTEDNIKIRSIIDQWIEMLQRKAGYTTEDRFRIQMTLFELLSLLARIVAQQETEDSNGYTPPPSSIHYAKAIAEAIKTRFHSHTMEDDKEMSIRIQDIAASLGIAPGYALEVFRKVYGMSPRQYLSELKLHEAKVLIQQHGLALKEIAARLGYSHLSHFSRQFKRWTGMSPLQYRQQLRK